MKTFAGHDGDIREHEEHGRDDRQHAAAVFAVHQAIALIGQIRHQQAAERRRVTGEAERYPDQHADQSAQQRTRETPKI